MKSLLQAVLGLCLCCLPVQVSAHSLWINCVESLSHHPGHALISLGYGHQVPMDDLLNSPGAKIEFLQYNVTSPNMQTHEFSLPEASKEPPVSTKSGLKVYSGNLGVHKLAFSKDMQKGTWQVGAVSEPDYFTCYKDARGRKKWVIKPMNAVKGKGEIVQSCLYKAMAKACFTSGKWTDPKPLGHEVELIPKTDIAHLRAGDVAVFEVRFMNRIYTSTESNVVKLEATSNTFGGPDKYYLGASVYGGKAQFRFPTPGQWVVSINIKQEVDKDPALTHLKEKCKQVLYCASISLTVYP